jgi:AraC family transcriptional regulator
LVHPRRNFVEHDHHKSPPRRFRRLLEYIDCHLDEALSLNRLSREASLSKYHFHRRFAELFGIGVHQYIQLRRLKRASHQLAFRPQSRVIEIALANGYESPEPFCRVFRKWIGQSPTEFRRQPQWKPWHTTFQPLRAMRNCQMNTAGAESVTIANFPETRVAVFEHRGDPRLIGESLRKFIAWRRQNRLPPWVSATFNILYSGPGSARSSTTSRRPNAAATSAIAVMPLYRSEKCCRTAFLTAFCQ